MKINGGGRKKRVDESHKNEGRGDKIMQRWV
jgi:hypothetical protein